MRAALLMTLGMVVSAAVGFYATARWLDRDNTRLESATVREIFAAGNNGIRLLGKGWATPELWGTWSIGPAAELALDLKHAPADDVRLTLEARAFPHLPDNLQKINVVVNGRRIASLQPSAEGVLRGATLNVPAEVSAATPMKIVFEIDRPASPHDLQLGPDMRKLGIGLVGIAVEYRYKLHTRT